MVFTRLFLTSAVTRVNKITMIQNNNTDVPKLIMSYLVSYYTDDIKESGSEWDSANQRQGAGAFQPVTGQREASLVLLAMYEWIWGRSFSRSTEGGVALFKSFSVPVHDYWIRIFISIKEIGICVLLFKVESVISIQVLKKMRLYFLAPSVCMIEKKKKTRKFLQPYYSASNF